MMRKAKPSSRNALAKKRERDTQQYLWSGSVFPGNALRPALEDEDLRGYGLEGRPFWGEVKNLSPSTIQAQRGDFVALKRALTQCEEAIERNAGIWPEIMMPNQGVVRTKPTPFSVLWPVGVGDPEDERVLAMIWREGIRIVMTLKDFRDKCIRLPEAEL